MSLEGIKLAISDSGGIAGERHLPLMISKRSWELLHERCLLITSEGSEAEIADLLNSLRSAALHTSDPDVKDRLVTIITSVCETARSKWDKSETVLTASILLAYSEASLLISPLPALPKLEASWQAGEKIIRGTLEGEIALDPYVLDLCTELIAAIKKTEPRFLTQIGFPTKYKGDLARLFDLAEEELQLVDILDSADQLHGEAERLRQIADQFDKLSSFIPGHSSRCNELHARLKKRADSLDKEGYELEPPEEEFDYDHEGMDEDVFDILGLFADL